jgi:hypothetical protein
MVLNNLSPGPPVAKFVSYFSVGEEDKKELE